MAEGRAAANVKNVSIQEEGTSEIDNETKVAKSLFQDLKGCAFRTKKQIYNGLWPTTWDNLLVAFIICVLIMYIDHPKLNVLSYYLWRFGDCLYIDDSYPYLLRVTLISLVSSIVYFIVMLYARQYMLRFLLAYKGWLYQPPRSQSVLVLIWGVLVRIVSGRKPRLYAYQNSLPRMHVPPLKSTVKKLLDSLKPVLEKDEFQQMELEGKEFLGKLGPKLQWILQLKSWWSPNYVTDWWEKYVYMMARDPIAINSNYYVLDQGVWCPTNKQTARAAGFTAMVMLFKEVLDSEKLEPLVIRNTIPLCMQQYARMFSTARIPRTDQDKIRHHAGSEHIAVLAKGFYYKLYIVDAHGKKLNILDLQSQFEWIQKDAEALQAKTEAELHMSALTGSDRTTWANVRREHFTSGINRDSIHAIEEAIFVVVLDDSDVNVDVISERAKYLLHGNGSNIWFDKSISAIFFKNGKVGLNCEHGWGDAPVMAHMIEFIILHEYNFRLYDDKGDCKPYRTDRYSTDTTTFRRSNAVITPMRLYWDVNAELEKSIFQARTFAIKNNADLELCVRMHNAFGKGFIKKTKTSPDAFIQMALQLAYYKDAKSNFALTYESSMTRLFLHGRTETVRSLTSAVQEFVLAMNDDSVSAKEKVRLMKAAADTHQKQYRDCMSGFGCDRHLFALYIVCRGQGYESPFLKKALTMPWTLSTSQTPQTQMSFGFDTNLPEAADILSPGGGFGPVSDSGYGVSYMVPDDSQLYFHVSAKNTCERTSSLRMMDNIFWALQQMRSIHEQANKPAAADDKTPVTTPASS